MTLYYSIVGITNNLFSPGESRLSKALRCFCLLEDNHQLAGNEIQQKWQRQESEAGVRVGLGEAEKLQEGVVGKGTQPSLVLPLGEHIPQCLTQIRY